MSLSYPLTMPASIGIESIELTASNVTVVSESPFTFRQQVLSYPGQRWSASVKVPALRRDFMAPWVSFLLALKGSAGTFLLGDPDYAYGPRGTVSSCTLTGSLGSDSPEVVMTGSLLAGDYVQLGSGASSRLHKVLVDQTGSGTLHIWPALRANYSAATVVTTNTRGVFRLANSDTSWSIDNRNAYGISFSAVEAIS